MTLQKIGRYNIIAELGKGAMGVVYKATDPNIGRTVAVKTTRIDTQGIASDDLLRRFQNEARSAGTLSHPNIVTIYDAGEENGVFYIAMEYLEGETLDALLLRHRSLPVETAIEIVRPVCAALDYAHSHGVIHRDIKPANIMLSTGGAVKVMDFGIAKAGGSMTATGTVLGTPNYMSPEQVKGKHIDGRSDLFSVGVLLYELLTGEKPFDGQNITTIIYKIVSEEPIPPRELDVTIHPGLSAVVTKALAKAPDGRYQTGADLVEDLEKYKSLEPEALRIRTAPVTASPVSSTDETVMTASLPALKAGAPAATAATRAPVSSAPAAEPPKAPRPAAPARKQPPLRTDRLVLIGAILVLLVTVGLVWRVYNRRRQERLQQEAAAALQNAPPAQEPSAPAPPAPPTDSTTAATQPETPSAETAPAPEAGQPRSARPKPKAAVPAQPAPAPPTPAPTEAATTGTVHVTSTPAGAAVAIDGAGSFVTPFDSPLKPGTHAFTISKLGYAPVQRKLDVAAGKTASLDVLLVASGAVLEVKSDPAGAAILVDGKPTNKFTPASLAVAQGEHTIRLRMEGFKDENTTVQMNEGQTFSLSPKLTPAKASKLKRFFGGGGSSPEDMGTLEVTTHPDGAHITLNNAAIAQTTPAKVASKPGKYDLAIILPGYKTVHRTIEVEKGKTLGMDEVLEKETP